MRAIAEAARQSGVEAVLVGGAVRDLLLDLTPFDLDFAVTGDAIPLARRVANRLDGAFYIMDAERGVARAIFSRAPVGAPGAGGRWVCDFVTRRGRTWDEDLRDRDFTINAIACRLDGDGALIDPLAGADDLRNRVLRMAAPTAISADAVRAIRGVRLARQFGCVIDPGTWRALHDARAQVPTCSAERVRDAFMGVLALPGALPHAAMEDLSRLELLDEILPAQRVPAGWAPALTLLGAALRALPLLRDQLADAAAHDLDQHVNTILVEGRQRRALLLLVTLVSNRASVDALTKALRLSTAERGLMRKIHDAQTALDALLDGGAIQSAAQRRAAHRFLDFAADAAPEAICLGIARRAGEIQTEVAGGLARLYFDRYAPGRQPEPLLTGQDLLNAGLRPGVAMGRALDAVREAQLIGMIETRQQALALALLGGRAE
jgi:tRNA nucleotidyltransferase/poly(A) polymerase